MMSQYLSDESSVASTKKEILIIAIAEIIATSIRRDNVFKIQ